jgi:hypothetical protein
LYFVTSLSSLAVLGAKVTRRCPTTSTINENIFIRLWRFTGKSGIAGVIDSGDQPLLSKIFANFWKREDDPNGMGVREKRK